MVEGLIDERENVLAIRSCAFHHGNRVVYALTNASSIRDDKNFPDIFVEIPPEDLETFRVNGIILNLGCELPESDVRIGGSICHPCVDKDRIIIRRSRPNLTNGSAVVRNINFMETLGDRSVNDPWFQNDPRKPIVVCIDKRVLIAQAKTDKSFKRCTEL